MLCVNAPIPDGRYDAFVVDTTSRDDKLVIALTILSGEKKGEVVDVATTEMHDEVAVIGLPCSLLVENGAPRIEW
jgi:hypothetical protein